MPTVILLDVSLSKTRRTRSSLKGDDNPRLLDLAIHGIHHFLDGLASDSKLEYTALIVFSSLYEVFAKFSRDFESIKRVCTTAVAYDKTCIETALQGVEALVTEEWGVSVPINIVLVTDGSVGSGEGSLKESLLNPKSGNPFPVPFSFPSFLSIICLSPLHSIRENKNLLDKMIRMNYDLGEILAPEGNVDTNSVEQCFKRLLQSRYGKFVGSMTCGHFKCSIQLSPAPCFQPSWGMIMNLYRYNDETIDHPQLKVPTNINVIGFLDMQDISNPPYLSRHLVLPIADSSSSSSTKRSKQEDTGRAPSFCVLLHGSLKIEKMVAVAKLG